MKTKRLFAGRAGRVLLVLAAAELTGCDNKNAVILKQLGDAKETMAQLTERIGKLESSEEELKAKLAEAVNKTAAASPEPLSVEVLSEGLKTKALAVQEELNELFRQSGGAATSTEPPQLQGVGPYSGEITLNIEDKSGRKLAVPLAFHADAQGNWQGPGAKAILARLAALPGRLLQESTVTKTDPSKSDSTNPTVKNPVTNSPAQTSRSIPHPPGTTRVKRIDITNPPAVPNNVPVEPAVPPVTPPPASPATSTAPAAPAAPAAPPASAQPPPDSRPIPLPPGVKKVKKIDLRNK